MRSCEHYQAQLLEHLYGLLEGEASLALIEHAGACEECRAALQRADGSRKLLAAAAKVDFSSVRFVAPEPDVLPMSKPRKQAVARRTTPIHWGRWAAAAVVLIALTGLGVPVGRHVSDYYAQENEVDNTSARVDGLLALERKLINDHDAKAAKAYADRKAAEEQHAELVRMQQNELDAAADDVLKRQMYLVVTGHEALRPGVPNEYRIETKNMKGEKEKAELDIRVRDLANNQVVYEAKKVQSEGNHLLSLSPDLPQKASNQLSLEVVARSASGPQQGSLSEKLTLARSTYVTQLVTDKPMYQPGETVHFRSLTLDRFTLKPTTEDFRLVFTLENGQGKKVAMFDDRGREMLADNGKGAKAPGMVRVARVIKDNKEILGPDKRPIRGIGAGELVLPEDLEGGEYTLIVEEAGKKFPPERRKFLVNIYQKPRLNKELKFHNESYGPGDAVIAHCKVAKAEGGLPLVAQRVVAVIRVDGKLYKPNGEPVAEDENAGVELATNPQGEVSVPFKLPAKIERGDATLSVTFHDGGNSEPLTKPIPVVIKRLQVEFFPEGGDLVAGVPNRVYFQARTLLDKPAKIEGGIYEVGGGKVCDAKTVSVSDEPRLNQGMGVFPLVPKAGKRYELKIKSPNGIEGQFLLPEAVVDGVTLSIPSGVTTDQEPMSVIVNSATKDRELLIGAYCRGAMLDFRTIQARAGVPTKLDLQPTAGIGGVYRVTVFEKRGDQQQLLRPVAERLVYRLPAARLNLSVRADKKLYAPGEKVTLHLSAASEHGHLTPTVLLVGVVDKSVVTMADEKTARSMPTHFLLTSEVRRADDLEYADVMLSNDHASAFPTLDMLLGTQGWRRFLESDPERFDKDQKSGNKSEDLRCKADVDRLMVVTGKMSLDAAEERKVFKSFEIKQEQVLARFKPQFDQLEAQMNEADLAIVASRDTTDFERQKHELHEQTEDARSAYLTSFGKLKDLEAFSEALRQRALLALGLVLLIAGAGSLIVGLLRSMPRAIPIYAAALGTIGACGLVVLGTFLFEAPAQRELPAVAQLSEKRNDLANVQTPTDLEQRGDDKRGRDLPEKENKGADPGKQGKDGNAHLLPNGRAPDQRGADPKNEPKKPATLAGRGERSPATKAPPARRKEPGAPVPGGAGALRPVPPGVTQGPMNRPVEEAANTYMAPAPPVDGKGGEAANGFGQRGNGLPQFQRNLQLDAVQRSQGYKKLEDVLRQNRNVDAQDLEKLKQVIDQRASQQVLAEPCFVRVYAHRRATENSDELRTDFTETVYWHPVLFLPDGKGEVSFDLSDSVTTFQVAVAGHTGDGRLGAAVSEIQSRRPFTIDAKVPAQVTRNDVIELPITIANDSDEQRRIHIKVDLQNLEPTVASADRREVLVPARQRTRIVVPVKPKVAEGNGVITIRANSEPFGTDAIQYSVKIVPEGFTRTDAYSDVLEVAAHHEVVLPREWVKNTLRAELQVYPSALADLQKGLAGLLREPNGCFEQTSTSNYPNVLILKYLRETNQEDSDTEDKARTMLDRGYHKLVAFECQQPGAANRQGYEWFGGTAPAHEALTAYGLLQFRDMAGVGIGVDKAMVERTRKYLLSRRDTRGGFLRNAKALDSFGRAPEDVTNAYIVWALTESDKDSDQKEDLSKEIAALVKLAQNGRGKDPYFLALVANSLLNRGMDASALLKSLSITQKPEGYLDGSQTSITGSGGRDLQIEATALGVMAWLKANRPQDYDKNIRDASKWIGQQRGGHGGFGATQATILALKALIGYAKFAKRPIEAGTLTLVVNGKDVASQNFGADFQAALTVAVQNVEDAFKPGKNDVQIKVTGKSVLPYTLSLTYSSLTPKSPEACPVRLSTKLDRGNMQDGETVQLKVKVENTTDKGQSMVVAVIGLPAGLNVPDDMEQLKNYAKLRNDGTEPGKISHFEIRGRELVLYWRGIERKATIEVDVDLICRVPGNYRGPASRAYLYYNADHKHWIDPVQVAINPK
ncbi:MAG: hypothetical protein K2R98_32320 [Gemmataceae bacterium]|nr:hypothetical protein [Gemmataceae bacterium]